MLLDYMKRLLIRAAVNKSLEQGIVTEDLAAKGATAYKTSDIEIG
jgi:3-isopropylmalate dehydrogenase